MIIWLLLLLLLLLLLRLLPMLSSWCPTSVSSHTQQVRIGFHGGHRSWRHWSAPLSHR
jgi:hypothetical protein